MKAPRNAECDEKLIHQLHPRSPVVESFRILRANLRFVSVDQPLRTLLVTSALPMEGKSLVAANLAIAVAQSGDPVVLVDGDLRRPILHSMFGLPQNPGLTTLVVRGNQGPSLEAALGRPLPRLAVLPAGPVPPNPTELLASRSMAEVLRRLTQEGNLVIIDSPPVLSLADAAVIAAQCDGTVLVVQAHQTPYPAVQKAKEVLSTARARILGVVLDRVRMGRRDYYYYYYYHRKPAPKT